MTSSSIHTMRAPRPAVKRASQTWPGIATSRNHFQDFLREIGSNTESAYLCCVPRNATVQPHVHARQRSTSNVRSKAISSPSRAHENSGAFDQETSPPEEPVPQLRPVNRGRTLSTPKVTSGNATSGLPILLKSPALSSIDLENHDANATYSYFHSARDTLLAVMGEIPVDERPSRAPTRTSREHDPADRSPDSEGPSRPSPVRSSRAVSRGSEQRSRTRSSARSSSRTPSIDSVATASSSEAPATPKSQSVLGQELPTSLEELERRSRFRVQCVCMSCKRAGSNFPSCAKCGEMYCSRECRTGGTHACRHGRLISIGA